MSTDPITPRQQGFIARLADERSIGGESSHELALPVASAAEGRLSRGEASELIDALKAVPSPRQPQQLSLSRGEVPEGRYALPSDYDPEGTPVFYKVDHGNEGTRWEGYVFLERIIGPNEEKVRNAASRNFILDAIAEDVPGALRRYGHLSGHCGNCGLELTDKFSRFIGVGPICREKLHLPKSEASFVREGGVLPDSYKREVAAEEEAAIAAAEVELTPDEQTALRVVEDAIIAEGGQAEAVEEDLRDARKQARLNHRLAESDEIEAVRTEPPPPEDEGTLPPLAAERTSFRTDENGTQGFGLQQLHDAVVNGGQS
jgi:hypothetical protein